MNKPGRKPKVFDNDMLETINRLIRTGKMRLQTIARNHHTTYTVFIRNMKQFYGETEWNDIVIARNNRKYFKKGQKAWNAGIHTRPDHLKPYHFKKGCLRGIAARGWKPIGAIVIRKKPWPVRKGSGRRKIKRFRWIKIADKPYSGYGINWILYARYKWEKLNGSISKGMCVVHLDMNTLNDNTDNLMLMSRIDYQKYLQSRFPEKHEITKKRMSKSHQGLVKIKCPARKYVWECGYCEYQPPEKIEKCPKCGRYSFNKIELRLKIA